MKIIIVGCGKIGTGVIESLVSEGHDIVAVDQDAETLHALGNIYDVMCVCGNGVDCATLEEAGVDIVVAGSAVYGADDPAAAISALRGA